MSFRYYPMYLKGNPQLRVYLPNFWMKLLQPKENDPKNLVTFKVPVQMTNWDIRNYLEKIYKVPVVGVRSEVKCGDIKPAPGAKYLIKGDDYRLAYISLPKDKEFNWPNLFPDKKIEEEETEFKKFKRALEIEHKKGKRQNWSRNRVPSWFGV